MVSPTCCVIGAGDFDETADSLEKADVLIAADGGFDAALKIGAVPEWVIGDFDSSSHIPAGRNVVVLPREKDDTDMMAAVKKGLALSCRTFYLYGGTGGRIDHTFANIQTLDFLAQNGARGYMIDKENVFCVVRNGELVLPAAKSGYVSVFCLSDSAAGVTVEGLKYSLTDAVLTRHFPLGVSNEFIAKTARIAVRNGTLLVVFPRILKG